MLIECHIHTCNYLAVITTDMELIVRQKKSNEHIALIDMSGRHDNTVLKNIIINSIDPTQDGKNVNAKMTNWNLTIDYPPFNKLGTDICQNYVYDYLLSVHGNYEDVTKQKLIVSDMWGIVYEGNGKDESVSHSHHWWNTSFVYYVDVGDDTSPLIFDDYDNLTIQPSNSLLVLFDSKARHHVPPYTGETSRIVISGNIEILKLELYKDILKNNRKKI